jgi:hypothetical protein
MKTHYEELRSFFNTLIAWTLGALSLIGGIGAWAFYSNLKDARAEARAAIDEVQKSAEKQIAGVRTDSARLAQEEARRRVEEAFAKSNVTTLIDETAKKEVGAAIQRRIGEEFERSMPRVRSDITAVAAVFDMATRMRMGHRPGWEALVEAAKSEPNETARQQAVTLLARISGDYAATFVEEPWQSDSAKTREYARNHVGVPPGASDREIIQALLASLSDPKFQMMEVAYSFQMLKLITGNQFRMFDVEAVKLWAKGNGYQ